MSKKYNSLEVFDSINFSDLLLKVEIDSASWVGKSAMEKLSYLKKELAKVKNDKLVSVASKLVSALISLIRYNTGNTIVNAYLGVIETALGLAKASMVLDNVFISAKHEIRSDYDMVARFIGVQRGIDVYPYEVEVTPDICKAFISMPEASQRKYHMIFRKIKEGDPNVQNSSDDDDDADKLAGDQNMLTTYIEASYRPDGSDCDYTVGFEIGYYVDKHMHRAIDDAGQSYAFANVVMPLSEGGFEYIDGIGNIMYAAYIDSIDISKNIIEIWGGMLRTRPRPVIDFDVKNFDLVENGTMIRSMSSEAEVIRKVLDSDGRRGYIVQGDQGTGKTISVNKLLMSFTDVPVFWISANSIGDSTRMMNVFRILNMFPGSIFVFDDFDGNDLSGKNPLTTTFISCIDETTSPQFRGVIFLIINEPQRLHSTIKLRPGRIDDIIYVRNPATVEQVADIVTQRFVHMKVGKPEWVDSDNGGFVDAANMIISSSLTHAFISSIVDDLVNFSDDGDITCERFKELIMRRNVSIRNAKMVAMDDGHIVEMSSQYIGKNHVIGVTNTQG